MNEGQVWDEFRGKFIEQFRMMDPRDYLKKSSKMQSARMQRKETHQTKPTKIADKLKTKSPKTKLPNQARIEPFGNQGNVGKEEGQHDIDVDGDLVEDPLFTKFLRTTGEEGVMERGWDVDDVLQNFKIWRKIILKKPQPREATTHRPYPTEIPKTG